MSTGTIGRLIRDHGFGFIKTGDGIDLFFHCSEVRDVSFALLKEGQKVDFKASLCPEGLKATNVKLLKNKAKTDAPNKDNRDVILLGKEVNTDGAKARPAGKARLGSSQTGHRSC